MASIKQAVEFVLRQEDAKLEGVVTDIKGDSGGRTRFGIAETSHPELTATNFYGSMPSDAALLIAQSVYARQYGVHLFIDAILDQLVANALLSFAINEGVESSVKVLQRALQGVDNSIAIDGEFGPHTLDVVNRTHPPTLLRLLGCFQRQHYTNIVAANPSDAKFLNGWINRVTAACGGLA